jgi:Family of unknown function (DUF6064)
MTLPFTADAFFAVFARYHAAVWPAPVVLNLVALAILVLVFRGGAASGRWVAALLALLWAWMALVYHFAFFATINPAAWVFGGVFLLGAGWMTWVGVVRSQLRFIGAHGLRGGIGLALIVFALAVYPASGPLLGHHYPALPTFGVPCPTTIFTIGVLLLAAAPVPRSLFVVPVLWAIVGSTAVFAFGVVQDLGLLVAGVIAAVAMVWPSSAGSSSI